MALKRIQITNNFYLDELVDPHTYLNDIDHGFSRLDMAAVKSLQLLRDLKGSSIRVNNWWSMYLKLQETHSKNQIIEIIEDSNSVSKFSGFRPAHCKIGASKSAHKLGKAFDPKGNEKEMFKIVEDNAAAFYALGLRRLEDISITKGWLHMDTESRNCKPNSIRVIDRAKCTKTIYF
jgi:hypothetical protein